MTNGARFRDFAAPAAIVILHLVLAALAFKPAPHAGGDNAVYLSVAQSILEGGYQDLFLPGTPPHVVYPPGFPLITALGLALGLEPWVGLKLITVFFSATVVFLTWLYARREGSTLALIVALLLAISPGVLALSHWELSDVPFTAFVIAALIAWRDASKSVRAAAVASLLTVAAYSIRSAGLPLIVAGLLWLALGKHWKHLAVAAAIMLLPAAAWWLYSGGQGGYFDQLFLWDAYASQSRIGLLDLLPRIKQNTIEYSVDHLPLLMAGPTISWLITALPLLVLAIPEWILRIDAKERSVLEIFVPLYAGMTLLWLPQFSGDRLILPLYPFMLLYAGLFLIRIGARLSRLARRALLVAAPAAFVVIASPAVLAIADRGVECTALYRAGDRYPCVSAGWRDFFVLSDLAATMLPRGSIVMSRKPAVLFTMSGHRSKLVPFSRDPSVLIDSAQSVGARYVVVDYLDTIGPSYVVPAIMQRTRAFCVMHTLGPNRATLFGIVPNADRVPDERPDPGKADIEAPFAMCGPQYRAQSHQP
jgi:hypothetical protein